MTRSKELRRINAAIENRNEDELRWSLAQSKLRKQWQDGRSHSWYRIESEFANCWPKSPISQTDPLPVGRCFPPSVPRCYDCAQSGGQSTALNGLSRLAADTAPLPPARLADTRAFSEVVMLGSARCLGPSVVCVRGQGSETFRVRVGSWAG